jgi:hypothetical protein
VTPAASGIVGVAESITLPEGQLYPLGHSAIALPDTAIYF